MKKQVYLFEISDTYNGQVKLPYSTGLIWGHCILDNTIKSNYELGGWIYYLDKIDGTYNWSGGSSENTYQIWFELPTDKDLFLHKLAELKLST